MLITLEYPKLANTITLITVNYFRVPQVRHQEKVMIPVMANPNVNFMGLLIGPRGNSLKKLEEETNTKIMIRGLNMCVL